MTDLKIRHTLLFELGHVSLNRWGSCAEGQYPGNITGYSGNGFVITGTQPGGGFLYREQVSASDSMVVFPWALQVTAIRPLPSGTMVTCLLTCTRVRTPTQKGNGRYLLHPGTENNNTVVDNIKIEIF